MKFMITLITAINLFMSPFLNNAYLSENEISKIPKIIDSIKGVFNTGNDQKKKNAIIVLDENKKNKVNVDDLIVTTLETDRSSGFLWQYEFSEPGITDIIFDNYIPGKDIGPGKQTFIFKTLAEGKCELKFKYFRQGEDSSQKSVTYKIFVK